MKRFYKFLMPLVAIVAMALPWNVQGQDTLTVADGTTTNEYVPVYGYWIDNDQHNQMLYPASMLTNMAQSYVTAVTFYLQQVATSAWGTNVTVKLMETTATSLTNLVSTTGATTVWSGVVNGTTTPLTFTFTTPYIYQGGNLLIDVTATAGTFSSNYWYGVNSGSSVWTYGDGFIPSSIGSADDGDYQTFLPKATFTYNASGNICLPPTGFDVSYSLDDANFIWNGSGNSAWEFVYGPTGFNPDSATSDIIALYDSTYTIDTTTITSGFYEAYVRTDCGSSEYSMWIGPVAFHAGIHQMNMATSGTDTLHTCNMTIYDDGGAAGSYSSNISLSTIVIFPADDQHYVSVSGTSYTEGTYDYLRIYDGVGTGGEVLFDDYGVTSNQTFGPFSSGAITVTFHSDGSVVYDGFQINVSCVDLPSCIRPTSLNVGYVSADTVELYWNDQYNSNWLVVYGPAGFNPDTAVNNVLTVTDTFAIIDNLTLNTQYDFYMMALCSNGDTTLPRMASVRTLAGAPISEFPYFCGFEIDLDNDINQAADWVLENGTQANYWMVGSATANGGTNSLYITNNGTSNAYTTGSAAYVFAYATFMFEAGEYAYSYDWKAYGESSYDFIRAAIVPNTVEFTAGDYCGFNNTSAVPAGGIAIDGAYRLNLQSNWQNQVGTFTITTPGVYKMVFMWRNDASGGTTPPAAIDNIQIVRNTCPQVANLTAAYVGADTIILSWQPIGEETSWEVATDSASYVVTDTFYVASGLSPNTQYNFTVRAICSSTDSSMYSNLSVRTQCGPITVLPYIYGFEGLPTGSSSNLDCGVPCWGRLDNASTYHFGYIGNPSSWSTGGHTGTGFLYYYMPTTTGTYADWIITILPPIDVTTYPLNTLQVSFWVKMNSSTTSGDIQVGVISNPADASTFIPVDTVHVSGDVYDLKTSYLNSYVDTANAVNIALKYTRNSSTTTYYFVDDVTIEVIPDCPPVNNIVMTSQGDDNITISWSEVGNATSWEVEYGPAGFTPGNGTTATASADSINISGLSPNTAYDFYVTPTCTSGVAATRMGSFRTACGPVTVLPLIENFDGVTGSTATSGMANILPPCWDYYNDGTRANYQGSPYVYNSTTYSHSGGNCIRFYSYNSSGDSNQYLILPFVDSTAYAVSDLQVSFWLRGYSTSSSYHADVVVGVMTNPADEASFIPYDTIICSSTTYEYHEVMFSQYAGANGRITLLFPKPLTSSSYEYGYVDDVTIEPIPSCPPVSGIALNGLDSNFLTVVWVENGTAASWNVEYGVHGFTLGTGTTATVSTTPTITINGLSANTEYDVYITPDCSGGTAPTRSGTFRTANTYIALPYSCGFENAAQNALWTLENGSMTNKWYIGSATNNGGSNALYISNDNGASNSYSTSSSAVVFAYTDVMISAPGDYGYAFDWKAYGESSWDYIRVALVPVSTTLTASSSVPSGFSTTGLPAGWIALDGGSKLNLQSNWQNRTDVVSIATAGVYHLVFAWRNDGSGGTTPPAAIDNVVLAQITCARPQNVTLSNLTQTSVDVAWNEMGTATNWQYQLDNGTPVAVTDTFCSLTNLTANTAYTFRVRAICGQGDTSFWTVYNFRTPCSYLTLPYTQDFEAETTGSSSTGSDFANCMTRLNNGTSYGGYPYVGGSSYNHTANGTRGLYWYNSTTQGTYGDYQCVVMPPIDPSVSADSLQLSFWTRASSASYTPVFQIGVMTDPNNISTFVGVDTVTITSGTTWTLVEIPLVTYSGTGKYVAIKADRQATYWYAYVDDITLEYVPTCLIPQNLTSTTASTTSITVDWTDLSQASAWEIRYGQGNGATTSVNVTYHPYTITGLDTLTSYNFEVRAICTVGDTSRWSQVAVLGTELCDNAVAATTGNPTGTSYYTPVNNYYNYTLSETIIDSAELVGLGEISAIAYSYAHSSASTYKTNVTIWLQPTNKTVFTDDEDMVALDTTTAVQVYSGSLNCSQGWNYFQFSTPYTWDGHSNLLVIVDDNSGDYNGSSYVFNTSPCTGYKTITWYDDDENPSPTNLSNYDGVMDYFQYRATMKLVSCGGGCPMPVISSLVPGDDNITVNYITSADSVEIVIADNFDPAANGVVVPATGSYTYTGLTHSHAYSIAVRAHCEDGAVSDWALRNDSTLMVSCGVPTGLQATGSTYSTVTVSWTAAGDESAWSVRVYNTSYDQTYTSQATSYTIPNLVYTEGSSYNVSVRALCGQSASIEGDWCDPITVNPDVCQPVTGIAVNDITANSAVVSWTAAQNTTGYTVQWGVGNWTSLNDAETATVTANTYTITGLDESTQYSLFVINNCTQTIASTGNQRVPFTTAAGSESIADVENGSFVLAPNPASTSVTLSLSGFEGAVKVEMVDMNGRVNGNWTVTDGQLTIDLNGYAQGAYFVRVTGEQQTAVRKLIVR